MEYLAGSLFTFLVIYVVGMIFARSSIQPNRIKVMPYTQSSILQTTSRYTTLQQSIWMEKNTQSFKFQNENSLRIYVLHNNAYWIADNSVFVATIDPDGNILEDAKPLDIMGMNKVQLDEINFVVEKLTEGTSSDIRNSRDT